MPVKIEKDNSISISGFEGIGQSPLSDFTDMMGINLDRPGVASVNFKFESFIQDQSQDVQVFTANASTNELTVGLSARYRGQLRGRALTVSSSGTLPAGLAAETVYFAATDTNGTVFKLATSIKNAQDGNYVDITDTGTGVHTVTFLVPKALVGWCYNSYGNIIAQDTDNRIWDFGTYFTSNYPILIPGNTRTGVDAAGIVNYKGYTIVFRSNAIDALLDKNDWTFDVPTWTNGFNTINVSNDGKAKPFYSLNDDTIYFYNGDTTRRNFKIGLLEENAGQTFDPASGATFAMVEDAVTIPFEDYESNPTAINEINEWLIIGTGGNKIYFWDKKSPSFTKYIEIKDSYVVDIQNVDNTAYCITLTGKIFTTNGTTASFLTKIPDHLIPFNPDNISNIITQVTTTAVLREKILIGMSIDGLGARPNSKRKNYIFELNTNTGILSKYGIMSWGEETTTLITDVSKINLIMVDRFNGLGNQIMLSTSVEPVNGNVAHRIECNVAKRDFSTGSPRLIGYNNYEPYIITGVISYGEDYAKKTLRELQISFMRAISTGEGLRVSYRLDDNSAWTLLKTVDYTTYGAIKDIKIPAPITDIKDIQFKINLSCYNGETSGNSYYTPTFTTPFLKSIRLIP